MAKTAALMLAALFVMTALVSSSSAATGIDYSALVGNSKQDDRPKRPCDATHQCRGNRKLFSESEMSVSVAVQATEKEAEDLKTKFTSLSH